MSENLWGANVEGCVCADLLCRAGLAAAGAGSRAGCCVCVLFNAAGAVTGARSGSVAPCDSI